MALHAQVERQKLEHVKELEQTIIDAGIAIYGGGNPDRLLQTARNRHPKASTRWRMFNKLVEAKPVKLAAAVDVVLDDILRGARVDA